MTAVALGLSLTGSGGPRQMVERAVLAEERGVDSVWTSEAWGSDAFTPLAAIAARTSGSDSAPPSRRLLAEALVLRR